MATTKKLSISLPEDLADLAAHAAETEGTSLSGWLTNHIREWVDAGVDAEYAAYDAFLAEEGIPAEAAYLSARTSRGEAA